MTVQCPECSSPVEGDFGLVTCGQCGAMVLMEEGPSSQVSDASGARPTSQSYLMDELSEALSEVEEEPVPDASETMEPEPVPEQPLESMEEDLSPETLESGNSEPLREAAQPPSEEEFPLPYSEEDSAVEYEPEDMNEVVDFGNSETPMSGPLSFDLVIGDIDTPEDRQALVEILTDQKLQLDVSLLKRSIKDGELKIGSLPAVKAAVIVKRLRPLSLKVVWHQKTIYSN